MNISERSDTEPRSQWPVHAHTFSSPQPLLTPHFPFSKSDLDFFSEGSHWSLPTKGPDMFIYQHRRALYELRAQTPMRPVHTMSGLSGLPHEHLRLSYTLNIQNLHPATMTYLNSPTLKAILNCWKDGYKKKFFFWYYIIYFLSLSSFLSL